MSRDKHIEEMANYIDRSHWKITQDFTGCHINSDEIAQYLYNADYRKSTDLVEEIFAEIEKMLLDNHIGHYKTTIDTWCYNFNNEIISEIAELKKKYTEREKDK